VSLRVYKPRLLRSVYRYGNQVCGVSNAEMEALSALGF
jgi:hypothetical protein